MKQFIKSFLIPFLGFILMIAPLAASLTNVLPISPSFAAVLVTVIMISLSFLGKSRHDATIAGIEVELWVKYIIERLWKDNQFLKHAYSDDEYVVQGKIVHIPQPGAKPVVRKNRASFPAAAVRRTDTDITYVLDEYSSDPTHVHHADQAEVSYDKMDSVMGDHIGAISETVADDILIKWATGTPSTHIRKTTGADTEATLDGATGMRKSAVHTDVRKMNLFFNTNNVPKTDRYGLIEENMADQIFESLSENQYRGFTQYANAETGVLGRLYNFDLMTRSSVLAATSSDAIKALDAEILESDNAVSLFWQKNSLARALGQVEVFENIKDATFYGDVISSAVRMGGRRRRADNHGVGLLIQGLGD